MENCKDDDSIFKLNAAQSCIVRGSPCPAAPAQFQSHGSCLTYTADCLCSSYSYFGLQCPQYARAVMLAIQMQKENQIVH